MDAVLQQNNEYFHLVPVITAMDWSKCGQVKSLRKSLIVFFLIRKIYTP